MLINRNMSLSRTIQWPVSPYEEFGMITTTELKLITIAFICYVYIILCYCSCSCLILPAYTILVLSSMFLVSSLSPGSNKYLVRQKHLFIYMYSDLSAYQWSSIIIIHIDINLESIIFIQSYQKKNEKSITNTWSAGGYFSYPFIT